jgi:hypothetical protein
MHYFSPKLLHHDNFKAELYHLAKLKGLEVILEYKGRKTGNRADAILVVDKKIKAIIELKSSKRPKKFTKQRSKYVKEISNFDIPIIYCKCSYEAVEKCISILETIKNNTFSEILEDGSMIVGADWNETKE